MPSDIAPMVALEDRISAGEKLFSPSAARNSAPIRDVLVPRLKQGARILEIGSGTGEHAEAVCKAKADVTWQPTDIDPASLASQAARAAELRGTLLPPMRLDMTDPVARRELPSIDVLVCSNVIHISPWAVAEGLVEVAATKLNPEGFVFLYGPFLDGEATAPSNLTFDQSLRERNPAWGVRSLDQVTALFDQHGFELSERIDMPANNLALVWRRTPA